MAKHTVISVTCYWWLGANKFVTNAVSRTVPIHKTLLLLTPNFLIVWVPEESIWASTHSLVTQ